MFLLILAILNFVAIHNHYEVNGHFDPAIVNKFSDEEKARFLKFLRVADSAHQKQRVSQDLFNLFEEDIDDDDADDNNDENNLSLDDTQFGFNQNGDGNIAEDKFEPDRETPSLSQDTQNYDDNSDTNDDSDMANLFNAETDNTIEDDQDVFGDTDNIMEVDQDDFGNRWAVDQDAFGDTDDNFEVDTDEDDDDDFDDDMLQTNGDYSNFNKWRYFNSFRNDDNDKYFNQLTSKAGEDIGTTPFKETTHSMNEEEMLISYLENSSNIDIGAKRACNATLEQTVFFIHGFDTSFRTVDFWQKNPMIPKTKEIVLIYEMSLLQMQKQFFLYKSLPYQVHVIGLTRCENESTNKIACLIKILASICSNAEKIIFLPHRDYFNYKNYIRAIEPFRTYPTNYIIGRFNINKAASSDEQLESYLPPEFFKNYSSLPPYPNLRLPVIISKGAVVNLIRGVERYLGAAEVLSSAVFIGYVASQADTTIHEYNADEFSESKERVLDPCKLITLVAVENPDDLEAMVFDYSTAFSRCAKISALRVKRSSPPKKVKWDCHCS